MRVLIAVILMAGIMMFITPAFGADAGAGKAVYAQKCASCHGAAGEGKDSVAKMFKVDMKPLTSKEVQSISDADMKKIILEGKDKMKPVKDVDAKAADDIIAFVRTLKK